MTYHDSTSNSFSAYNHTGNTSLLIADNGYKNNFRVWLPDPSDTAHHKYISWEGAHSDSAGNCQISAGGGNYKGNLNAITEIKFYVTGGTFETGRITMYGLAHA
jgi:hypothetical protein